MNFKSDARLYDEAEDRFRTAYQRDRDRIIHSRAFRRLKHKTQVFVAPQHDHYRTRLTHTIEVAQIARTLAVVFECDESLTETLALAHDLGHPPFGHAGEATLDDKLKQNGHENGFNHNIQTLRVLTKLEKRSPYYQGLNLTKAVIEGTLKHSFPLTHISAYEQNLARQYDVALTSNPMLEAQIAGIADDIAYNHHDMDDGLRAEIFSLEMMQQHLGFISDYWQEIELVTDDKSLMIHMLIGKLLNASITDLIEHSQHQLTSKHQGKIIAFSNEMQDKQLMQKKFLATHMYQNPKIMQKNEEGQHMLSDLFDFFKQYPEQLPPDWQLKFSEKSSMRVIADYLAGMGDDYATKIWQDKVQVP